MTRDQANNYLQSSGFSDEQIETIARAYENSSYNSVKTELDCISRQAVLDLCERFNGGVPYYVLSNYDMLSSVSTEKTGRCKDCKWWRDSDGAYRRGVKAESRCPINTVSVANGVGYCYMFEPKMGVEE